MHDKELRALDDCKPMEQEVEDAPSISLATILESRRLTSKMKVALAYILARSVWQFYNSDWMNTGWTGETIHFMQERGPVARNSGGATIYASKPYLSVRFGEVDPDFEEFSTLQGKIHRYPRVLALGIMLIEIAIGSCLRSKEKSRQSSINADWTMATAISRDDNYWREFYPMYRTAVVNCLDQKIFASAAFVPGQKEQEYKSGLEDRRAILYKLVVHPLELLLTNTGWLQELGKMEPIDPADTLERPREILSPKIPATDQNTELTRYVLPL